MNSLEKEVNAVADEWVIAFERADIATLDRLMSDNYTLTSTFGVILDKAQTLEFIQSGTLKLFSANNSDRTIRLYDDVAVVQGLSTVKAKLGDRDISEQIRYTEVMVKRRGRWSINTLHGSVVDPTLVFPPR